jgi:hypothetical protein
MSAGPVRPPLSLATAEQEAQVRAALFAAGVLRPAAAAA